MSIISIKDINTVIDGIEVSFPEKDRYGLQSYTLENITEARGTFFLLKCKTINGTIPVRFNVDDIKPIYTFLKKYFGQVDC